MLSDNVVKTRNTWPTPTAITDSGGAAMCKWGGSGSREKLKKICTPQEINGALNPDWVEWLMSWPIGWTSLEPMDRAAFDAWLTSQESWWDHEPPEIPRVSTGIKHRAKRLKAIGNGQVPICAAAAFEYLNR